MLDFQTFPTLNVCFYNILMLDNKTLVSLDGLQKGVHKPVQFYKKAKARKGSPFPK
jgi:hypothetical protein